MIVKQVSSFKPTQTSGGAEWGILRNECKRSRWGQNAVMLQSRTPGCKWSKAQSGQAGLAYLSKPLKVLCSLRNLFKIQYSKVAAFTMHKNLPKGSSSPLCPCFGICGSIHLSGIHGKYASLAFLVQYMSHPVNMP